MLAAHMSARLLALMADAIAQKCIGQNLDARVFTVELELNRNSLAHENLNEI
jgi:hypothetical protein